MNQKTHNKISFWSALTILGSLGAVIITIIVEFDTILTTMGRINVLFQQAEHIEHLIDDQHQTQAEIARFREHVVSMEHEVDSLELIIKAISFGKAPYQDTVWYYRFGDWHKIHILDHPYFDPDQ